MWVPNGYTKFDGSKKAVASSPGSTPGGMFQATFAMRASSPKVFPLSGEPFTANFPSFHSRSASFASSRWAAIFFALSFTRCAATFTALPHTAGGPAAVRPPPLGGRFGVAGHDLDVLDRDAELVTHDLREGRLLALAVWLGADVGADHAGGIDAHDRAVVQPAAKPDGSRHLGGAEAADLAVGRDADAQVAPFFAPFGLLGAELLVVEHLERLV